MSDITGITDLDSNSAGDVSLSGIQEAATNLDTDKAESSTVTAHTGASTDVHGLSGGAAVVGDTSTQTLTNKTLTTPTIASFANANHNHQNSAGGGVLSESALSLSDVTTNDASASAHGFLPKLSGNSGESLLGNGTWGSVGVKFGGTGADGALTITSGTTTIDCSNAAIVVKNYTSISITGTGSLAFSNPNDNGTIIILKSQGGITLTSSAAPMIDVSNMGAAGGASVSGSSDTAGNNGSDGWGANFLTNKGSGAGSGTVGSGGAVSSTFKFRFLTKYLKYTNLFVGAGGGSGSINSGGSSSGPSGAGGRGGGCLVLECGGAWNFTTASGIKVSGQTGGNGTATNSSTAAGGGGNGGGGMLLALYNSLTANSGTVTTSNSSPPVCASVTSVTCYGGGGGGSMENAGSAGESQNTNGANSGGLGGDGNSLVVANEDYA